VALVVKKLKAKDKIVKNHRTLSGILEGLRSQGKIVVMANGCFDLLHPGHVRCLEDAKSRGDFLVAVVHEDKAATKIMGKGFPINEIEERMETLSGLASVDYVTTCDDVTAEALVLLFQPQMLAKGTGFTERTTPERAAVKSIGSKVIICGDKKQRSAQKIVQRITKRKFE